MTVSNQSKEKIYSNTGNEDVLSLVPANATYILDIGCGDGANARILVQQGCTVDGITISEGEKQEAQKVMRHVFVHNAENGLPIDGAELYDVVICSHVLEHICYPKLLMQDIRRVLKVNGVLIVGLPNLMHYSSRWQLAKGNFNYTEAGIWDYTHFRWYTFKTGIDLLQQNGLTVEVATVTGKPPLYSISKKLFPASVNDGIFSLLKKISKGLFGYQLLYRAVKKTA